MMICDQGMRILSVLLGPLHGESIDKKANFCGENCLTNSWVDSDLRHHGDAHVWLQDNRVVDIN